MKNSDLSAVFWCWKSTMEEVIRSCHLFQSKLLFCLLQSKLGTKLRFDIFLFWQERYLCLIHGFLLRKFVFDRTITFRLVNLINNFQSNFITLTGIRLPICQWFTILRFDYFVEYLIVHSSFLFNWQKYIVLLSYILGCILQCIYKNSKMEN